MLKRLALSLALVSAADAVYLAVTRPLIGVDTFGLGALVALATVESLAFIPAFVAASASEAIGRRRTAAVAALAPLGLLLVLQPRDLPSALLGGALYSVSTATIYNLAFAGVIEDPDGAVRRYALAGLAMSLGWGAGSTLAWPLFYALGPARLAALLSLLVAAAALLASQGGEGGDVGALEAMVHPFRALGALLPVAAAGSALHTLGMSAYGVELDEALARLFDSHAQGRMLYGALRGGLPVLIEAAVRLQLPTLVERLGAQRLLVAGILASAAVYSAVWLLPPQAVVAAWLIVVAAFTVYDGALYALVSERAEGFGGAATGAVSLASGAGNLAVAALSDMLAVQAVYLLAQAALAAAAVAPIALEAGRAEKRLFTVYAEPPLAEEAPRCMPTSLARVEVEC